MFLTRFNTHCEINSNCHKHDKKIKIKTIQQIVNR